MNASDLRHQRRLLHESVDGLALIVAGLEGGLPPDLEEPLAASLARGIERVRHELSASLRADAEELAAFLGEVEETFAAGLGEPPAWILSGLRQWSALLAEPESVDDLAEAQREHIESLRAENMALRETNETLGVKVDQLAVVVKAVSVGASAGAVSARLIQAAVKVPAKERVDRAIREAIAEDPMLRWRRAEDWAQVLGVGKQTVIDTRVWKEIQAWRKENPRGRKGLGKNFGSTGIDQIPDESES